MEVKDFYQKTVRKNVEYDKYLVDNMTSNYHSFTWYTK